MDRLIDEDTTISFEPVRDEQTLRQVKDSLVRDLENLLNSRRNIVTVSTAYQEVNSSLFVYGLPDYTNRNPGNSAVRSQLRLEIEKTVTRFEPRLKNVTVQIDSPESVSRELKFRITGILVHEAVSEVVVFDTQYDPALSSYTIVK